MREDELRKIVSQGETSRVQFKLRIENNDSIAAEFIAMANSKGGKVIVGVQDKTGDIVGLDYVELQSTGSAVSSIANELVKPQVFITTEAVSCGDTNVLVIYVEEGIAKPYKDRNGTIWIKQGCDKRKLTDNSEQIRLFQQNGLLFADEMIVPGTGISDIDESKVKEYLAKIDDSDTDLPLELACKNLNILKESRLTLGGLLFFSKNPQRYRPAFCIKAVSFFGNEIEGVDYRDSEDITGTIPQMFEKGMGFLLRNLHHVQKGQNFNSTGILEISRIALEEVLQNALTHRDYTRNSPINLLVFDDRVELASPGCLPNSLTIENIRMGNAVVRNNLIVSFSSKLMKYRGLGSGIRRAVKEEPSLLLDNDKENEKFVVTFQRAAQ
ncbi:MAG: putative DNA binding domain-containing protein [Treponema sp.]|nr:putative DNA binding domain-containing protein [Treponema sp.]